MPQGEEQWEKVMKEPPKPGRGGLLEGEKSYA